MLKGPQGTLFGRNTTGGAILYYTKQPTYDVGGYASGLIGNYNWHELEGAVNVPVVDDHIALRIAGQYRKRDGYTRSGDGFAPADGLNTRAFRISLLVEPTDTLKNVTVYDFYHENDVGEGIVPYAYAPGTGPNAENATFRFFGSTFDCNISPTCDLDLALQRQKQVGPRVYYSAYQPLNTATIQGISNTTTLDLGDVTFKNIIGYRRNRIRTNSNTDGTEMILLDAPLILRSDDQITDEIQSSGSLFGGSLKWLAGGFYLKNDPDGPNAIRYDFFRLPGETADSDPSNALNEAVTIETSKAVFLSLSQDLGGLVRGLKLNASGRYTWDNVVSCSDPVVPASSSPTPNAEACERLVGAAVDTASFHKFTWSIGLDYQASRTLFLYAVSRRGYRAGGINTPNLGGTLTPFQSFGPQTITDGEIGLKADWSIGSVRGRTNIAGYIGTIKGLQQQAAGIPPNTDGDGNPLDDPTSTALIVNAGKGKIRGIDIDGYISPVTGLRLTYAGSLFHGRISGGAPVALAGLIGANPLFNNAPKSSYTLGIEYKLPFQPSGTDIVLNGDYYRASSYQSGLFVFPPHHTVNISLDFDHIGGSRVGAQLFVQNLTQEVYPIVASASGSAPGVLTAVYNPPRMFGLRLRYHFGAE